MAGSKDTGRTIVAVSGEGSVLHAVKIRRQRDTFQLIVMKRFTLQTPLDAQTVLPGGEAPIDLEFTEGEAGAEGAVISATGEVLHDPDLEEPPAEESSAAASSIEISMDDVDEELALLGLESTEEKTEDSAKFVELLQMVTDRKTRMVVTLSEPQIFYHTFETDWELKGRRLLKRLTTELATLKEEYHSLDPDAIGLIPMTQGHLATVVREGNFAILQHFDSVKSFLSSRLPILQFMESVEVSLVNLIRFKYELPEEAVTLLLYVGQDNSRFIFMKGGEIHHISQMIADGANSPTVANTIASRLLFELDDIDLPGIDSVFLLGEAATDELIEQLSDSLSPDVKLEKVEIDFLDRSIQQGNPAADAAPYAAAIGAALRALDAEDADGIKVDLTPTKVKESQNTLIISTPGWILLALIPLILAFTFYRINVKEAEVREMQRSLIPRRVQMDQYRSIEDRIEEAQTTLASFERSFSVIDSLVVGTDTWSSFLTRMNRVTGRIGGFWFTDLTAIESGNQVRLVGYSLYRNRIPRFVEALGHARLERVDVQEIREKRVYRFEITAQVTE